MTPPTTRERAGLSRGPLPPVDRPAAAAKLWVQARGSVDIGQPGTGLRLGLRALKKLERDQLPDLAAARMRARILITIADAQVELGQIRDAATLLDEASQVGGVALAADIMASRMVLLARTGNPAAALEQGDLAIAALSVGGRPSASLIRALHRRALLHLGEARLESAQADTERAGFLGRQAGLAAATVIATHTLGLIKYVSGDLPGALHEMNVAEEIGPEVRAGLRALDRARVLLSAGLVAEAGEYADRAEKAFAAERSRVDLADSLLVQADIDLAGRRPRRARLAARRAARSYAAAHHQRGMLAARVVEARAESILRASARQSSARPSSARQVTTTAAQDAADAAALAADLIEAGLLEDARAVRLLQAEALLATGDLVAAEDAAVAAAELGSSWVGGSRTNRPQRYPSIATELHTEVVAARLDLARGRRSSGIGHIRRGLDDLAAYQARFGSQDLQSASAVHGLELTRLGLRTALQTRSPAAILQWLERSRAASTRLAAVRPSADGVLAKELSKLRIATYRARAAVLAGAADPELEDTVDHLRHRVRSRSWVAGGTGAVNRPLPLAAVQRVLSQNGPEGGHSKVTVVAPFRGGGRFHALVITATTARYLPMDVDFALGQVLQRIIGDLNVLADHRILPALRRVAGTSLKAGLGRVARAIVDPLLPFVNDGPVVVAAAGEAAIVPWALLPGLSGRAVSVSPSVTAAIASLGDGRQDHRRGVLAVAGPDVPHGIAEVETVANAYSAARIGGDATAGTAVLTGSQATGRAVLEAMPAGGLLHIAAHGHHEPDNPLFSGVMLADGLLYGYDVAPNPALPAQVVLSSCDVGRTDDRPGGEPLGLVAALLRSGVSTVVAGTSRVSDQVAAAVMTAYHQRLSVGQRPAIALAGAIETVTDQDADPAPFTCFGAGL